MFPRDSRHDCGGQILVVALLGIVLLAGMVFYVINVGDQVNRRVAMQNAADAAAISGAAWMARSMNVIGMNNGATTRMLALVPILDAFPLSVQMAHEETGAWVRCLEDQLTRGVTDSRLRTGLESLRDRVAKQRDVLAPLDDLFNHSSFRTETGTFWQLRGYGGPPPHGQLWRGARSLDEMSQAALDSGGVLAQANAVRYGRRNEAEAAFVVPVLPVLPGERTNYGDFERPVKAGRIPDRAWPHRLGPYDRLFKWRNYIYRNLTQRGSYVPPSPGHGAVRGGRGNVNVSNARIRGRSARGTTYTGHWARDVIGRILRGYNVYGPYQWMRRRIHGYSQGWWQSRGYYPGELADTFFHEYHKKIGDIKPGYMWGSQQLKQMHSPLWVTDYPPCVALGERPDVRVTRTMFYVVEIRSKYPKDHPSYLSSGTYVTNGDLPIAMWVDNCEDPADLSIAKIGDWIWEDTYSYETTEDTDIGIAKQVDATGQPIWQNVYMVAQYVFGGIDVGGEGEVRNPANYTDREDLPAPILIDTAAGDYEVASPDPKHDWGVRRDAFTYLGVSRKDNAPAVWASRFGRPNPSGGTVAVAQAEIFNARSWGLWTQDWKVKLVPVTGWGDWMGRLDQGVGEAADTAGFVDPAAVEAVWEYLSRFDEQMVGQMMQH